MTYSMQHAYCHRRVQRENPTGTIVTIRSLTLLAAVGLAAFATPGDARGLQSLREQDAAYRATQQGQILPLPMIRSRVRIPGAVFIGAEFDGRIYRLKYMRGPEVIWIDVDARTGRLVGRQ
jgi:hypothetical protein